ncbi:MAG: peptidylprolyl isomerase [Gracilimonas sp.]|nr:peptidylprolyl isomerase [Gracilimonas sp.]
MKNKLFVIPLFLLLLLFSSTTQAQAPPQLADQIVAHVNEHVILKSDVDQLVSDYMRQARAADQNVEFSRELWFEFLKQEVDRKVLLEKAEIDSITVSNEQVSLQMDQRIQQLTAQAGSEQALEQAFGKSIIQLKADFREDFREQMLASRVQEQKRQSITITRPEVEDFFNAIPTDSLPTIPEQVSLSQIVKIPPARGDAKERAFEFAEQLRDSIVVHGKSIEELARRHSEDSNSASMGGLLPLMSLDELVPEYSAAAAALQPGGVSEVVETQYGYHVIQLDRRIGDRIETRHILITVDGSELDEEYAINRLNAIRDSILANPEVKFPAVAKELSEDPNTAPYGGKIFDPQTGERLIALNRLDPAMYRVVLLMDEEGAISEPRSFTIQSQNKKAYRIVRLDKQVPEHIANLEQDYERIKNIALQQKQFRVMQEWMQEIKEDVYIEYKIDVPGTETNL